MASVMDIVSQSKFRAEGSSSLTDCLPTEVLCKVFMECLPPWLEGATEENDLSWINVSYVCHRWRAAALQCPGLWSKLNLSHPTWTTVMLHRAKMAPLTIRTDLTDRPVVESRLRSLSAQISPQIEILDLCGSFATLSDLFQLFAISSAVLLSQLNLTLSIGVNQPQLIHGPPKDSMPPPRLNHLEFTRCLLALDSSLYTQTTCLTLRCTDHLLDMKTIFDALAAMPILSELTLINALTYFPPHFERASVNLPHLRKLVVVDNACNVQGQTSG